MKESLFILVKVTVSTSHKNTIDVRQELAKLGSCHIENTRNVSVLKTELIDLKQKQSNF
ncbi:MAG TPA: hypothetical protein VGI43_00355 [Mucilaginibacter sp.]|jgi:hypothetical protein